ncbi:uncharacterized protein H6S33_008061 [Morchella sextelata]|uniref:uncharacterized protein n=1 Tax=Morchella sextelata TaxID=1174677 RepID=UPI001D05610A|nr:uncharacterized protein H6S33_008061 [Morchella sextelata]KAH0603057.1 hypothetical protein H6S33_008061 [Morchella sextelata]
MPRACPVTRASKRLVKARAPTQDRPISSSSSASQLRTTAAAALEANSQLGSSSSAGRQVQSSSSTHRNGPDSAAYEAPLYNLHSPATGCPYCPFTTTQSSVEFEGFNIIIHPCPCGQDHAHATTVLAHHLSFCSGKADIDNELSDTSSYIAAPPPAQTIQEDAISWGQFENIQAMLNRPTANPTRSPSPPPRRWRQLAPHPPCSPPAPVAGDLQPSSDGPDCDTHAEQQRASPHVCITCTQPFTTRVHVFKNGRIHTPFMLYSCGCGERFSREYPNMRVRVDIKQEEHQALETDIEAARERVRKEFGSVVAAAVRRRVRSRPGAWVLAKGVEEGEEGEGDKEKGKVAYLSRSGMSKKWNKYAYGLNVRRKMSELACEVCGEEFADVDKVAMHRRGHQVEESEMERRSKTCDCGSVFRTKEDLEAHGSQCRLVRKDKRGNIEKK